MLRKYEKPLTIYPYDTAKKHMDQHTSSSSNAAAQDSEEEVQNKSSCLNEVLIKSKLMTDHE